jgi:hypothetical protein
VVVFSGLSQKAKLLAGGGFGVYRFFGCASFFMAPRFSAGRLSALMIFIAPSLVQRRVQSRSRNATGQQRGLCDDQREQFDARVSAPK